MKQKTNASKDLIAFKPKTNACNLYLLWNQKWIYVNIYLLILFIRVYIPVRMYADISFCCTCFSMGDLGVQVSVRLSVHLSVHSSFRQPWVSCEHYPGCLVSATPLTVLYWSFWNFACVFFMAWRCACGLDIIVRLFFCDFFHIMKLVIFHLNIWTVGTSCERNSFYSFILIVLKLCICFLHGMRMCIWFGYNCKTIFCHFFHIVNLSHFYPQYIDNGYLLWAQVLLQFCTDCFETLLMFFFFFFFFFFLLFFFHGMRICMWFGYSC